MKKYKIIKEIKKGLKHNKIEINEKKCLYIIIFMIIFIITD